MPVAKTVVIDSTKRTVKLSPKKKVVTPKAVLKLKGSSIKKNEVTTKSAARPTKSKVNLKPKVDSSAGVVNILEGTPSLRLKEKVRLYKQWYDTVLPAVMAKSSLVAGYLFILLGAGFVTHLALSHHDSLKLQMATLICNYNNCVSSTPLPEPVLALPSPTIEFTAVPDTMLPGESFIVTIRSISNHSVFLVSSETAESIFLNNVIRLEDGQYRYTIANTILPGRYTINVRLTNSIGSTQQQFVSPRTIQVLKLNEIVVNQPTTITATGEATTTTNTAVSVGFSGATVSTSTPTQITSDNPQPPIQIVPEQALLENLLNTNPLPSIGLPAGPFLRLSLASGDQQAGLYRLSIVGNRDDYQTIEIYAQATNSNTPLYLGVATKVSVGWIYWFNTENLPVGNYQVYALTNTDTNRLRSSTISIAKSALVTQNANIVIVPANAATTSRTSESVQNNELKTSKAVVIGFQSNSDNQISIPGAPTSTVPLNARLETISSRANLPPQVMELLQTANNELQSVLTNYAAAFSTNDEDLQRMALVELEKYNSELAADFVLNGETALSIFEVKESITAEINRVVKNIQLFNELTLNSNQKEFLDTDQDGISDTDEIYLYETDPFNPDSDGDGFLDGIEIMRGFNPQDPQGEVIINYESPRDFSFVNDEKLKITAVIPLVDFDEEFNPIGVRSVISGRALPNSFVTLYIFSTPTVVTVRTDAEGGFEYVFSKELEDGAHEVFVALTDNSGSIVARSNGFSFVKTAQAFTYADAESSVASTPVSTDLAGQLTVSYYLVAAMGVIAFGLILLLLGRSIGGRKEAYILTKGGYDAAN